jgi:hypothetical protein
MRTGSGVGLADGAGLVSLPMSTTVTLEDLLITAAEVLVAQGRCATWTAGDASRLAAERPWVVADALDRSPTLRRAVDERLAARVAASHLGRQANPMP